MSAYLELALKGGGVAIVETGMIGAAIGGSHDAWKVGSSETPTRVVLRGGETLDVVQVSPAAVIARIVTAREKARVLKYETGVDQVYVDWLTPLGERDAADAEPVA